MAQAPPSAIFDAAARQAQQSQAASQRLQVLTVFELEGSSPITVALSGGCMVEVGAAFGSESRGGAYTPLGGTEGMSTVTGVTWGKTQMTLSWDAVYMKPDDVSIKNASIASGPEGLLALFTELQLRGRECLVTCAAFARRGILREAQATPGRGYTLGGLPGTNLGVQLSWEWSGTGGARTALDAPVSIPEITGNLAGASAKLGMGLANGDFLKPNLFESLSRGIARIRGGITRLRAGLQQIGDLAKAPANLANQAFAAARSLGNALRDIDTIIHDTADEYKAAGKGFASLLKAKSVLKTIADGVNDCKQSVADVFAALARRQPRTVGVHPGQSLSDVAKKELGSADRWTEIAKINEIQGQVVPRGIFQVELPAGGR